ncbi:universal stress protein [Skermanella sp. TT6]|uniref:Universal stress protein n=1 Tax=Skermanella cutis TaxID=2775420 RepID=A0ABX7B9P3_9PROT|nr:universal stress protein [Skermanella sp. TT6]QQP90863.1 universal stress protein [Skermanella sp. TT6]
MLRKILVPLIGRDCDRSVLAMGFSVAKTFDAHVEALHVGGDPRDMVPMLGDGLSGPMIEEIMKASEQEFAADAEIARKHFEAARAAAQAALVQSAPGPGMASGRMRSVTGVMEDVIPHEARLADLVVFPQTAGIGDSRLSVTLEATLLGSARPLLLAPERPPAKIGGTVAIAWNGGAECARAVAAAMPFLIRAAAVRIVTADTAVTSAEEAARLADYLAWHGIQPAIDTIRPAKESVGAALIARVGELEADLLVMGGYGHSRVREMILGGVTRYVLSHPGLPVLMAH